MGSPTTVDSQSITVRAAQTQSEFNYVSQKITDVFGSGFTQNGLQPHLHVAMDGDLPEIEHSIRWPVDAHVVLATRTNNGAESNTEIIGASVASVRTREQLMTNIPARYVDFQSLPVKNGWLPFLHVTPEFRGTDIKTQLVDQTLTWLREETPVNTTFTVTWNGDERHTNTVLEEFSFSHIGTSDNYYMTMEERKICPVCDTTYCKCSGDIWKLHHNEHTPQ